MGPGAMQEEPVGSPQKCRQPLGCGRTRAAHSTQWVFTDRAAEERPPQPRTGGKKGDPFTQRVRGSCRRWQGGSGLPCRTDHSLVNILQSSSPGCQGSSATVG